MLFINGRLWQFRKSDPSSTMSMTWVGPCWPKLTRSRAMDGIQPTNMYSDEETELEDLEMGPLITGAQWHSPKSVWNLAWVSKGSGCCRAVMADTYATLHGRWTQRLWSGRLGWCAPTIGGSHCSASLEKSTPGYWRGVWLLVEPQIQEEQYGWTSSILLQGPSNLFNSSCSWTQPRLPIGTGSVHSFYGQNFPAQQSGRRWQVWWLWDSVSKVLFTSGEKIELETDRWIGQLLQWCSYTGPQWWRERWATRRSSQFTVLSTFQLYLWSWAVGNDRKNKIAIF